MGLLILRVLCFALLCYGIAAAVILKALAAIRRGEPYRFAFFDGGLLLQGTEAPPRVMIGVAIAYAIGVSALFAWPLGLYELATDATSACRDVVPLEEVQRLGGADFTEVRAQELGTMCSFDVSTPAYDTFRIEVDGYTHAAIPRDAIEMPGGISRQDERAVRHLWLDGDPHGSIRATLASSRFDEHATQEIARRLAAARPILAAYAAEAHDPPSPIVETLRRYAPYLFLAAVLLTLAGAIVVVRIRRQRAMQKVLEED